jgi:hypothetical protein
VYIALGLAFGVAILSATWMVGASPEQLPSGWCSREDEALEFFFKPSTLEARGRGASVTLALHCKTASAAKLAIWQHSTAQHSMALHMLLHSKQRSTAQHSAAPHPGKRYTEALSPKPEDGFPNR